MSDRVQIGARGSPIHTIEYGEGFGKFSEGWVVPADSPTRSAQASSKIDETVLNAFSASWSSSSLIVTIDPGEAFNDGWLATDVSHDVGLASGTAGQTVYVGWDISAVYSDTEHTDRDDADRVIVGLEGDFANLDPKMPLWTFDTDGSGVTSATDERQIGPTANLVSALVGGDPVATKPELYTDSDTINAIESGNVDHVQFSNIEDVTDGQIGRDDSIGFLGSWGSNGTGVLWDAYNVQAGSGISISGGTGAESNPTIATNDSQIDAASLDGASGTASQPLLSDGSNTYWGDARFVRSAFSGGRRWDYSLYNGTGNIYFANDHFGGAPASVIVSDDSNASTGSDQPAVYMGSYNPVTVDNIQKLQFIWSRILPGSSTASEEMYFGLSDTRFAGQPTYGEGDMVEYVSLKGPNATIEESVDELSVPSTMSGEYYISVIWHVAHDENGQEFRLIDASQIL